MIPALAPTFEAALRDVRADDARFRAASAAKLAEAPEERRDEAVRGLLRLANDEVGAVREAAYESLGALAAIEGLSAVLDAFDDPNLGARQSAVLAAGRIAPDESADAIAALLEDARPEMRYSAIWTLSHLGPEHSSRISVGLRDEDQEIRALTAERLGEIGATESSNELAKLLTDPADAVQFAAATALAALGDSRAAPVLRAALVQPGRALPAAIGLGDLHDRDSVSALKRLATHPWRSPISRAAAARALVRLGEPVGTEVIRKIVRSWRIEARGYAVQLVGELGLTSLLPDLRRALRRSRESERAVYETALEQLAPSSSEAKALLASLRQANHPR